MAQWLKKCFILQSVFTIYIYCNLYLLQQTNRSQLQGDCLHIDMTKFNFTKLLQKS